MFESKTTPFDRKRFLYIRVIIDYLKNNNHRIAHHSMSKTPTPLSSRSDIKPLLKLINGETADILTIDSNNRKTFIKSVESNELIAHFLGDISLHESLEIIHNENKEEFHYIFVTNGILTPQLLQDDYNSKFPYVSQMTFLETRFDPESVHKIGDPSIYMRKVVGQIHQMGTSFNESPDDYCECGGNYWNGTYKITYWGKNHILGYDICGNCGIQRENAENASSIMNFVQGISSE